MRWWAALGILMRGQQGYADARAELRAALSDDSSYVRTVAAQSLGQYGTAGDLQVALRELVALSSPEKNDVFVAMAALNALEGLGAKTKSIADAIMALPAKGKVPDPRYAPYVPRLLQDLQTQLK